MDVIRKSNKVHLQGCGNKTVCGLDDDGMFVTIGWTDNFRSFHIDRRCRNCDKLTHRAVCIDFGYRENENE